MKESKFQILLIFALLGLLVLLAGLQYKWLGQISDAERVRLEERLKDDTKRFAEDFNREIQTIYYNFQLDAENFENNNWNAFNKRFTYWKTQTELTGLIKDFYFYENAENSRLLKFDRGKNTFSETVWSDDLSWVKNEIASEKQFSPILEKRMFLVIPVYKKDEDIEKIIIQTKELNNQKVKTESAIKLPEKSGFLLIKLNEDVIKTQFLPSLVKKYFSNSDAGNYKISIKNKDDGKVFQTHDEEITSLDSTAKFFNLTPNDMMFFSKEIGNRFIRTKIGSKSGVFISRQNTISTSEVTEKSESRDEVISVNIQKVDEKKPQIAVFESRREIGDGVWTLNIQNTSGSLEQFITNTRNKNLGISFGILSLLAVSIILIFVSSQRAKAFAQRQIDFVSSVSHEFRTPLAVIYSAGENLSDGVVGEREKVSDYGNLIKREGKKLSGMVEQILEFAGANSGRRKYDFRRVNVAEIIDEAIAECQPIIDEKGFEVEKVFDKDLPIISADEKALTLAIQNLINNSLKYSNGNKWLKISAENADGNVKIVVKDRGIGISKKDLKQIFEPFYRSKDVVDEQISGNGLGLSLVKQIVEAHGGKVEVESEIGKGSKFIVHLPLNI